MMMRVGIGWTFDEGSFKSPCPDETFNWDSEGERWLPPDAPEEEEGKA